MRDQEEKDRGMRVISKSEGHHYNFKKVRVQYIILKAHKDWTRSMYNNSRQLRGNKKKNIYTYTTSF